MKVIYVPSGKAKEYCSLALNIYNGCNHGCRYCYAPMIMHRTPEQFSEVRARSNIVNEVKADIRKDRLKYANKKVLLSFISDPYPEIEKSLRITRQILEIFADNKIIPVILTKSGYADRDFDILKQANGWYGATLTFIGTRASKHYEPGASFPDKRIELLKLAHDNGIKTWVSLEPVIIAEEALRLIDITHNIVDEYKVGKLNYNTSNINWIQFHKDVVEKLKFYKKKYYIKTDLRSYKYG